MRISDWSSDVCSSDLNRREEAGDDLRAPETHLPPGKDIAHEGGRHHQQEDHDAEQPHHFARRLVRPVIKTAAKVEIDDDEEHARAVHVRVAHEPARLDRKSVVSGKKVTGSVKLGGPRINKKK